jgi:hypothetical protein
MVLLAMTRREWIHAVLRIARQGYYFVPKGPGQWRAAEFGGSGGSSSRGSEAARARFFLL